MKKRKAIPTHCVACCKSLRDLLTRGIKIKRGWTYEDAVTELHDPIRLPPAKRKRTK